MKVKTNYHIKLLISKVFFNTIISIGYITQTGILDNVGFDD